MALTVIHFNNGKRMKFVCVRKLYTRTTVVSFETGKSSFLYKKKKHEPRNKLSIWETTRHTFPNSYFNTPESVAIYFWNNLRTPWTCMNEPTATTTTRFHTIYCNQFSFMILPPDDTHHERYPSPTLASHPSPSPIHRIASCVTPVFCASFCSAQPDGYLVCGRGAPFGHVSL